jgi:hypothetical protein
LLCILVGVAVVVCHWLDSTPPTTFPVRVVAVLTEDTSKCEKEGKSCFSPLTWVCKRGGERRLAPAVHNASYTQGEPPSVTTATTRTSVTFLRENGLVQNDFGVRLKSWLFKVAV